MNKACALGAAALVSLALPATSLAAGVAPTFTTDTIVPNTSVAQFKLGESFAAVKRALPAADCSPSGSCDYQQLAGSTGSSMSFLFARKTAHSTPFLGEITVQSSTPNTPLAKLKTARGIGLGSTTAQVKQAYPHAVGSATKGYLFIKGPGEHGTTFMLSMGRVDSISIQSVHFG